MQTSELQDMQPTEIAVTSLATRKSTPAVKYSSLYPYVLHCYMLRTCFETLRCLQMRAALIYVCFSSTCHIFACSQVVFRDQHICSICKHMPHGHAGLLWALSTSIRASFPPYCQMCAASCHHAPHTPLRLSHSLDSGRG